MALSATPRRAVQGRALYLLLAPSIDDVVNERLRLSDRAPVCFCVAATAAGGISCGTVTNWNKSIGASDMNVATSVRRLQMPSVL
jgi:hypothetical protein